MTFPHQVWWPWFYFKVMAACRMWSYNSELCLFLCACEFMSNQFYTCVIITHMGSIQNILLCGVYVCVFWADSYYSISLSDLLQALYHAWYVYIYYRQDNLHYAIFTCTDFLLPALPLPRHCSDNICYLNFMFNNLFRSFHFFVHFGTALTCSVCVINILFILYGTISLQNLEKKIEIFLI